MSETQIVEVPLGERSYDIIIGERALADAGGEITRRLPGIRCAIITDENVASFHLETLIHSLDAAGIEAHPLVLTPGEKTKDFDNLMTVVDHVLSLGGDFHLDDGVVEQVPPIVGVG